MGLPQVLWLEHGKILTNDFLRLITKDLLDGWIDELDSPVRIDQNDGIGSSLEEKAVAQLTLAQGVVGPTFPGPILRFAQFSFYGWDKAGQIILHQVVVSAGFHCRNGRCFANRA